MNKDYTRSNIRLEKIHVRQKKDNLSNLNELDKKVVKLYLDIESNDLCFRKSYRLYQEKYGKQFQVLFQKTMSEYKDYEALEIAAKEKRGLEVDIVSFYNELNSNDKLHQKELKFHKKHNITEDVYNHAISNFIAYNRHGTSFC